MKEYVSAKQIRLIGKAWEVKRHLQILLEQGGETLLLSEYLAGKAGIGVKANQEFDNE